MMRTQILDYPLSVAPMVDCTDRHFRRLIRIIAPNALLYTEMLVANAINYGNRTKLLEFSDVEQPLVVQLAGHDADELSKAAVIAEIFGYQGINLNVGCPSPRVQAGGFGACLIENPILVARLVCALQDSVSIPVTVKCRIGTEQRDTYEHFHEFVSHLVNVGLQGIVVHARIAVLKGFSTSQNLTIPPLRYDFVKNLKRDFSKLKVVVNGGLNTIDAVTQQLSWADGVMLGRTAYHHQNIFADIYRSIYPEAQSFCPFIVLASFWPYVVEELKRGTALRHITRHLIHLFNGIEGAKRFRSYLATHQTNRDADAKVLSDAVSLLSPGYAVNV